MRVVYKVIIITVSAIIILAAGAIGTMTFIFGALDQQYKSAPQTFKADNPVGKALVIYQPSRTDVTKKTALAIANDLKQHNYDVTVNFPGDYLEKDVSSYDVIALGTPVYADKGSPLIIKYLKSVRGLEGKKLLLFSTGMVETDKAFDGLDSYTQPAAKLMKEKFCLDSNNNDAYIKDTAKTTVDNLCVQD